MDSYGFLTIRHQNTGFTFEVTKLQQWLLPSKNGIFEDPLVILGLLIRGFTPITTTSSETSISSESTENPHHSSALFGILGLVGDFSNNGGNF